MRDLITYLLILFTSLSISCTDSDKIEEPIITTSVSVDKTELKFSATGESIILKISANIRWEITNIPDWISLSITESNKDQEVTVTTKANNSSMELSQILQIETAEFEPILVTIYQDAKKDDLNFRVFIPSFSEFNATYELGNDNITRYYSFERYNMFAGSELQSKIFLGNLINRLMQSPTETQSYQNYTFNETIISTSNLKVKSTSYRPSFIAQKEYIDKIIANKSAQNDFSGSRQIEYSSRRELHLLGMGNLGVALDQTLSGKTYQEEEKSKKNGLIYLYNQTLFTIDMDYPDNGKVVQEVLHPEDYPNNSLAYISSVSYGRIGMLIIESDEGISKIKSIVDKIQNNTSLTSEENDIVNASIISNIYSDNNSNLQVERGKLDAIQSFYKIGLDDPYKNAFIYQFQLADYFDHAMTPVTYKLNLP